MEILVFLFVFSHVTLVLSDENVAVDSPVTRKSTYKVYPEPEDADQDDQMAESSQTYNHGVAVSPSQEGVQEHQHNQIEIVSGQLTHEDHQVAQQQGHVQEGLRHNVEVVQPVVAQGYSHQPQQIYLNHYPMQPIRILNAEASPLHQIHESENHKTLGFSSYVEHVSHKDQEEINSALKEGSVDDIKRLVPKSGISFKIYNTDKSPNPNVEVQKPEIQHAVVTHVQQKIPALAQPSRLHHRLKTELPAYQQLEQPTTGLQQTFIKPGEGEQQYNFEKSLPSLVGNIHHQQPVTGKTVHYAQSEVTPQKTFLEFSGKGSVPVKSHFKLNFDNSKATSTAEFNSLTKNKQIFQDFNNGHYQKQWTYDSEIEGSQKSVKNLKPVASLQYELDPVVQAERARGVHYTQKPAVDTGGHAGQTNFNKQVYVGRTKSTKSANFQANLPHLTKGAQAGFSGHLVNNGHIGHFLGNYANAENIKSGQNQILSQLGTSLYDGAKTIKINQPDHFVTQLHSDSEAAKSGQHDVVSHVTQNSYVETKGTQNSFDHQKALEGSTSFDIKNAIDNTGSLLHQTNFIGPTTEVHEGIQKQQLAYIIPKIPTSAVLIDDGIRNNETPVLEGHHVKEYSLPSPQLSYHAISSPEVSGKLFRQPQTIVWTSDRLKQGNALTTKDLHHSLLKLHLPKEEFYVKTPIVELPTSTVLFHQQKQPYALHYDVPVLKHPQEIHFQPRAKLRIQNHQTSHHIKLPQPVAVDWSLFKNTIPNLHTLTANQPEPTPHVQETGKKIVPILIRKRKNRSNSKQEIDVIYGKVNNNRRPTKPILRQEKNIRVNLIPEGSNTVKQFESKGDRNNEFSVSASYKVDRSIRTKTA